MNDQKTFDEFIQEIKKNKRRIDKEFTDMLKRSWNESPETLMQLFISIGENTETENKFQNFIYMLAEYGFMCALLKLDLQGSTNENNANVHRGSDSR